MVVRGIPRAARKCPMTEHLCSRTLKGVVPSPAYPIPIESEPTPVDPDVPGAGSGVTSTPSRFARSVAPLSSIADSKSPVEEASASE